MVVIQTMIIVDRANSLYAAMSANKILSNNSILRILADHFCAYLIPVMGKYCALQPKYA
jgi:hypothetical protein